MYPFVPDVYPPIEAMEATVPAVVVSAQPNSWNEFPALDSPMPWSTGLCDCYQDIPNCCMTCCCPCITFGRIAEIVDRGSTSCGTSGAMYMLMMGCPWIYSCSYRTKLRGQYSLAEGPCSDCCVHCCCAPCALCQEYRQLSNQGFVMSIGWHGNEELNKTRRPPLVQGGMAR